ncbi:transposase [Planktothrix sp. FACHB-1355]|uniref:Transposase n=1 Tax=Aerosakkonema funiforme FACHB-1375 TaxID=2949571 RepID=A0A926VDJ7_9CYAN|nr:MULTISPECIES: transposase [Oscillatoriales]MBD2181894.1 transposase [Aerosakkonema funiforme FACHB-1375]MBD3557314.1 transposase [Planktothrix sp. FACHB-1355]
MTVCRFFQRLDLSNGVPVRRLAPIRSVPPLRDRHLPPLTPRQAAFLVFRLSDSLSADEKQLLSLLSQQPDVAPAIELVQDFAALVRQRQHHLLDAWLQQATDCSFSPLVRFANGLVQDYQAVKAALTLSTFRGRQAPPNQDNEGV